MLKHDSAVSLWFNPFIPMKPQHCESNNNWLWCHDQRRVLFLFSSSLWRAHRVRGLNRRAQLFLKNQYSNFRLKKKSTGFVCLFVCLSSVCLRFRSHAHNCITTSCLFFTPQVQFPLLDCFYFSTISGKLCFELHYIYLTHICSQQSFKRLMSLV